MKNLKQIFAVILVIASVAFVAYFGVFVMFIGGIIQVVEACKQAEISSTAVAFGAARVLFAGIGTALVSFVLFIVNAFVCGFAFEK